MQDVEISSRLPLIFSSFTLLQMDIRLFEQNEALNAELKFLVLLLWASKWMKWCLESILQKRQILSGLKVWKINYS